ncbi:MAG: nucleoside hydrolase [Pseudomonadota bacterium]
MAQKIIIDTDPGIDDAMAILYAFLDPEIDLIGLTSIFGNVTIDTATRNALRLVEMAKSDIPVARGAEKPLVQPLKLPATYVHGESGFGDVPAATPSLKAVSEPAHEFICRMAHAYPGEIILCPIGPLTNIALALDHDPSVAEKIKSVTVMGSSLHEGGNVTPYAEANIWQDPHAADAVLSASWPVTLIGLDVTHRIVCDEDDFNELAQKAPTLGGFLQEAVQFYMDFHRRDERNPVDGCHMHDPSAVLSVIHRDLFSFDETPVRVILDGERLGETVADSDIARAPVTFASKIDSEGVKRRFMDTISCGF